MASRRASSRSTASSSSRSSARGPRVRTDGKVDVFCPQCGYQYRIAQENLDAKVQCTQCHRTFFAKTAVGKRARPKDHSKTYLGFGVLAVLIVVSFVAIKGCGGEQATGQPPPSRPAPVETGTLNPRVAAVIEWAKAIAANQTFGIKQASDLAAMQRLLGVSPEKDLANSTGADREELERALFAAFAAHEQTRYLRELECTHGMLLDEAMASAPQGAVRLYLSPPAGSKKYKQNGRCEMKVDFRMDGTQVRVTGWTVELKPIQLAPAGSGFIPHDKIAKPETKEIEFRGEKMTVTESEPVPLDHLPETSEAMRQMIDQAVADIVASADPEAPGGLMMNAVLKLKQNQEIRRAATPRLLNALYQFYQDPIAHNIQLNTLCRALRDCTGAAYAYPVNNVGSRDELVRLRQSAVKQWYAFWWQFHKHPDWDALIEKDESLEITPKDPAKK